MSSLLSQRGEFKLKKGSAFHWDFFAVGLVMLLCGLLGIPYAHGLIPQAPLHVQSLRIMSDTVDEKGIKRSKCVGVRENRLSPLFHDVLILVLTLWGQVVLKGIPKALMTGLFLFMGISSFEGNQFVDRLKLWIMNPQFHGVEGYLHVKRVRLLEIIFFTVIQLVCWAIIFGFTLSPASLIFPVLIVLLIPLRKLLLPCCFKPQSLYYLDNDDDIAVEENEILVPGTTVKEPEHAVVIIKLDEFGNVIETIHIDEKPPLPEVVTETVADISNMNAAPQQEPLPQTPISDNEEGAN